MVPLLQPTRSPGAGSSENKRKPARFRLALTAAERLYVSNRPCGAKPVSYTHLTLPTKA